MYDLTLAQKKHQHPMQFVWFQVISQSAFYHMIRLIIYTSYNIQTIQKKLIWMYDYVSEIQVWVK